MRSGDVDLVVVGADRIAANGDTANKIGTYTVAVLAQRARHSVLRRGAAVDDRSRARRRRDDPDRGAERARGDARRPSRLTPEGARIRNPAFDVTPQRYITAIITERGIFERARTRSRSKRARRGARPESARHRDIVRRDRGGRRRGNRRSARALAPPSNIVASQVAIHREWGGVVPELASRQHVRDICGVVERALETPDASLADLDAVAVTQGPGLVGSLLVGVSFAKALAWARGCRSSPVHHLAGHIESLVLRTARCRCRRSVLVVSGGHTSLYLRHRARRVSSCSAARETMRRGRRTTRSRSCSGWGIRAGR